MIWIKLNSFSNVSHNSNSISIQFISQILWSTLSSNTDHLLDFRPCLAPLALEIEFVLESALSSCQFSSMFSILAIRVMGHWEWLEECLRIRLDYFLEESDNFCEWKLTEIAIETLVSCLHILRSPRDRHFRQYL